MSTKQESVISKGARLVRNLGLLIVLLSSVTSFPAAPTERFEMDEVYGAIAYSPSTGRFGSSWNSRSPEGAERQAMSMCNRSDCRVLMPLANNCGALAVARNGGYIWATGATLYDAKLRTSNRCTQKYGGCKLICSVCSRGNEP